MSQMKQTNALDLIKEAIDLGLVGDKSISCFNCNAIFPDAYDSCPKCNSKH